MSLADLYSLFLADEDEPGFEHTDLLLHLVALGLAEAAPDVAFLPQLVKDSRKLNYFLER